MFLRSFVEATETASEGYAKHGPLGSVAPAILEAP